MYTCHGVTAVAEAAIVLPRRKKSAIVMPTRSAAFAYISNSFGLNKQIQHMYRDVSHVTEVNMDDIAILRYLREVYFSCRIMQYQQMKRYMVHLHNTLPYTPRDAISLLHRARQLVEPEVSIRDARISKKYIEFDTTISEDRDVKKIITRLEAIAPLDSYEHITERRMEKDTAIRHAVQLFNDEKYWQAHEGLEYVWRNSTGIEKEILNGIILVAAAFVHDEKDEQDVCISILGRARKKLDKAGGIYHGIDISRIADMISEIINTGSVERFTI